MTTYQITLEALYKVLNSNTVAVIIGGIIAGTFGFRQYRNQKTNENIEEKYFKKGIEALISYLQALRTKTEDSYTVTQYMLRNFRDTNNKIFYEFFYNDLVGFEKGRSISAKIPNSFVITSGLLNNEHFTKLCTAIFVDVHDFNNFLISEIIMTLRMVSKYPEKITGTKEEFYERLREQVAARQKEHIESGLYEIITILESILFRLREKNIDSYEKLKKITEDEVIKQKISDISKLKIN